MLIKLVIEAIPVYWNLLINTLKGILARIHKLCFNFMWKGSSEYNGSHLVNWKPLSAPISVGGIRSKAKVIQIFGLGVG
jgi:hypothetical protein